MKIPYIWISVSYFARFREFNKQIYALKWKINKWKSDWYDDLIYVYDQMTTDQFS